MTMTTEDWHWQHSAVAVAVVTPDSIRVPDPTTPTTSCTRESPGGSSAARGDFWTARGGAATGAGIIPLHSVQPPQLWRGAGAEYRGRRNVNRSPQRAASLKTARVALALRPELRRVGCITLHSTPRPCQPCPGPGPGGSNRGSMQASRVQLRPSRRAGRLPDPDCHRTSASGSFRFGFAWSRSALGLRGCRGIECHSVVAVRSQCGRVSRAAALPRSGRPTWPTCCRCRAAGAAGPRIPPLTPRRDLARPSPAYFAQ